MDSLSAAALPWAYRQRHVLWLITAVQWFLGGLLAFFLAEDLGTRPVLIWTVALWSVLALAMVLALREPPAVSARRGSMGAVLLTSGAWGASSLLLLGRHDIDLATLTHIYVLAGIAAAGGGLYAPYPPASVAAVLLTLLPVAALHLGLGGGAHLIIAAATLLYAVALLAISGHFGRIALRAMRTKAENEELARQLAAEEQRRRDEAERAERREQEQEAEQHARYRHLFANFRDPILLLDVVDNEFLFVGSLNPAAQELLGTTEHAALGQPLEAVVPDSLAERMTAAVIESMRTGGASRYDAEVPTGHGTRHFETTVIAMHNREGDVDRVAVIGRDVTERRQAERRLEEIRTRLQSVMRAIPDMVFLKDIHGAFLAVNPEFTRRIGKPESELLGKTDFELWGPELGAAFNARDQAAIRAGDICINEEWITFADGSRTLLETRKVPVFGEDGAVTGVLGVARDITDRKRVDDELRRSRDFLQAVIDGISDAVVVKDRSHRWLLLNRALCAWLGRPREELIGKSDHDYMPKEQADLYWQMDDLVFTGEEEHVNEEPVTGADGVTRYVQTKKRRVNGPDGETMMVAVIRDITERRDMEQKLEEREREMRTLLENMPDPVVRYDPSCRRTFVTPGIERSTDQPAERMLGRRPADLWRSTSMTAAEYEQRLRAVMETGRPDEVLLHFALPDGREKWDQIRLVPEFDAARRVTSVLAVARDVSELRRAEALLHAREEAFRSLAENTPDTIVRYDRDQRRLYVNPAFVTQSGLPAETLLGNMPSQLTGDEMSPDYLAAIGQVFQSGHEARIEIAWQTADGAPRCSHVRIVPERNRKGEIESVLAIGRDISEIDTYRRRILNLAFYDPMTGLANRALFNDRLQQLIAQGGRDHHITGVILIDLDGFKTINDSLGHAAGDELLREAGRRLTAAVRGYDTVARLGGDEFAVLLPELRAAADAGTVAHNLLDAFAEPYDIGGRELFVTASMGIALFPVDGATGEDLLKYADSAMYHAKARGRNTFQFYRAEMTRRAEERLHVEARLRKALANEELALWFQPQVALAGRGIKGAEALLRWNNPVLGSVSPERFISIAEDTGLIVEIGEWVLSEAARAAAEWNRAGYPLRVAVNISSRQFRIHGFVDSVLACLDRVGCRPEWIELEITESLLLEHNADVIAMMKALRSYGLTFAVDDFGTGYSALGYLQRFPIDAIKIDRSFIQGITNNSQAEGLVRAIVAMTEVLGLELVAEGVETEAQCKRLLAWGADIHAQGFLFGKPMSRAEFESTFLAER